MLTRFYDRANDRDGPVSGAISVIVLDFSTAVANSDTLFKHISWPAGLKFKITDIAVWCGSVTSDPSLTIGTTAGGAEVVAAVNLATGLNTCTVIDYAPTAGGLIDVRITADSGDAIALPVTVTITGFVMAAPTSVGPRTVVGTGF